MNMSWGQELLQTISILGWWRIVIILIATASLGILSSTGLVYLVSRFILRDPMRYSEVFGLLINKNKIPVSKPDSITVNKKIWHPNFSAVLLLSKLRNIIVLPNKITTSRSKNDQAEAATSSVPGVNTQHTPTSEVESRSLVNDLIAELDHNLTVIKGFDGNNYSFLQNKAWLTYLFSNKLSVELEHQLEQLYVDISLWNNMICVSTELNRQTDFSNERYQKSLFNISEKLKTISQIVK